MNRTEKEIYLERTSRIVDIKQILKSCHRESDIATAKNKFIASTYLAMEQFELAASERRLEWIIEQDLHTYDHDYLRVR